MNSAKSIDFMKEWCTTIISELSKGYSNKELFKDKIEKVIIITDRLNKVKNQKEINWVYGEIYNLAMDESLQRKKEINNVLYRKFHKELSEIIPLQTKIGKNISKYTFIKDWCITIIEFISLKIPVEYKEVYLSRVDNFNSFYNAGIFQGFKEAFRDINVEARNLPAKDYVELNRILISKFGKGINDAVNKDANKIKNIIRRGKIISDVEFRLIDERVNNLSQTYPQSPEIDILNTFLLDYNEKKK